MKRIAIVGGGIAGVSAAYELTRQQQAGASIEFVLFEATQRLGGIVETEHRDGFVIECGPDSWVTEKPWARALATELSLDSEIIFSRDEHRTTYLAEAGKLRAMPRGMRMMVPVDWAEVLSSPLFSRQAKQDYLREPHMAAQLKAHALNASHPRQDESVRDFVIRHFGVEVADTIAAPLLAGVFGGDIATLSTQAVLPAYVTLENEYGSLILGLQERLKSRDSLPVFSTLRTGLGKLIEAMENYIPTTNIRRRSAVAAIARKQGGWQIETTSETAPEVLPIFDALLIATPAKVTAKLLSPLAHSLASLLPQNSSSAIVVAFAFSAKQSHSLRIPDGFGFLVPQHKTVASRGLGVDGLPLSKVASRALLACTFVDQKFPGRVPPGATLLRAFFGGPEALQLLEADDATLQTLALEALESFLGKLPRPEISVVRRWPDSLPLYTVGHTERIAELESTVGRFHTVRLVGNAYRGVGLPDLIRDGRNAAREISAILARMQ